MGTIERRVYYAVRKRSKYLFKYANKRAEWTMALDRAYTFIDIGMAENFAKMTNGRVVMIEIVAREVV